jgi:DNA-binding NarL/FixJ family response regulator
MDTIWPIIQPYLSQRATLGLYYFETINNIRAAFEAGVDGYCFKDVSSQELINAISSVLAGIRYVPHLP